MLQTIELQERDSSVLFFYFVLSFYVSFVIIQNK